MKIESSCYDDLISDYAAEHTSREPKYLQELDRTTHLKTIHPRMIAGHLQGRFIKMITAIAKPKNILEIGTFTGYSTLCFAEAIEEYAKIYTIEVNPEYCYISDEYFSRSGLKDKIVPIMGDAMKVIPTLDIKFDIAFIDADKRNLKRYYELIIRKMNKNGIIMIDNTLWSGKVVSEKDDYDFDTEYIDSFNKYVNCDTRVENILLPFRDGIMIVRVL